jgi:hypothetical protein
MAPLWLARVGCYLIDEGGEPDSHTLRSTMMVDRLDVERDHTEQRKRLDSPRSDAEARI